MEYLYNNNKQSMPQQVDTNTKEIAILKKTVTTPAILYNANIEISSSAGVISQSNVIETVSTTDNSYILDTVGSLFKIIDIVDDNIYILYVSSIRGPKGDMGEAGTPADPLTIYPIGSIYITVSNTSPAELFGGQWEQLPANYALWTAISGAGDTISAGLPNIKGSTQIAAHNITNLIFTDAQGAFTGINTGYDVGTLNTNVSSNSTNTPDTLTLDANKYNSIYRDDINTVQPPAYKIYAWKRVA